MALASYSHVFGIKYLSYFTQIRQNLIDHEEKKLLQGWPDLLAPNRAT